MSLLDGQVAKPGLLDRIANFRLLIIIASVVFIASILAIPFIFFVSFAYFTAKEGPWWLDFVSGIWALSLIGSAFVLLLLLIVRYKQIRQDSE
jgi:hypothetical protein